MGKRSNGQFERKRHDLYPTPYECILPLIPLLPQRTHFYEPCAGDGRLIGYLQEHGHICEGASDLVPQDPCILPVDALHITSSLPYDHLRFITNPPWSRPILHPLILHLSRLHPTWLLFDADWAHTKQARPYLEWCEIVVSIGRVKWEPDSKHQGKDNAAWYLFTKDGNRSSGPRFIGRDYGNAN